MKEDKVIGYVKEGASQGWQCPQCERVYSPWQYECFHCNNDKPTTVVASTDDWSTGGKP